MERATHQNENNRLPILFQQAGLPEQWLQNYFEGAFIDKVEVSRENKRWRFHVHLKQWVNSQIIKTLEHKVKLRFETIAETDFAYRIGAGFEIDHEWINDYWPYFIETFSVNGNGSLSQWLDQIRIECKPSTVTLITTSDIALNMLRARQVEQKLEEYIATYTASRVKVQLECREDSSSIEQFIEQRQKEDQSFVEEALRARQNEAKENKSEKVAIKIGYDIKEDPVSIHTIQEEDRRVVIQGSVFGLEMRELKSGRQLLTFNLTDFTDSLIVKLFARDKEDAAVFSQIQNGMWLKVRGNVQFDTFSRELVMMASDLHEVAGTPIRMDEAEEKRVEFHLHTTMSAMDAIISVSDYIKRAAKWGHKAVAVTDHDVAQSFPEAFAAGKKHGIKIIYGIEANVINDDVQIVIQGGNENRKLLDETYVVFDVETTGLSVMNSKIIELAGVKIKGGEIIGKFSSFINPHEPIPKNITELTHITDDMVKDAPELDPVLKDFIAFCDGAILVAHNAKFDMGFMHYYCKQLGLQTMDQPAMDTLQLARFLYPTLKNHRLNTLAAKFNVSLENHHRAVDDAEATAHILWHMLKDTVDRDVLYLNELNGQVGIDLKNTRPFHCMIYALTEVGKKNLYRIISSAHTEYVYRSPRIPRSKIEEWREGLLLISGCEKGELYETVLNKSMEEAEEVAKFYDVLEVQPHSLNLHLVDKQLVNSEQQLIEVNEKIIQLGEKLNKPVIATGNVHYLDPGDKLFRDILIHGITGFSPLKEQRKPDVHFRTTDEMKAEFPYLSEDKVHEIVVTNPNKIADLFENLAIIPDKLYTPKIDGADEEITTMSYTRAKQLYGDTLPEIVEKRLEKELNSIITHGFSVIYLISQKLVKKSNDDGYLVGSRGSVGSSLVAAMTGISEVNPLPPHYSCPNCKKSEWFTKGEYLSGFDLPDKDCPDCGTKYRIDGQDIPFETFLGFKGDKVPDIDLNFSGEYQPTAHNYTKVLFGEDYVFRAGTIGTVADKTAFGYVKKFQEEQNKTWRNAEVARLAAGCTGVKRTTGQHPGGIIVVPDYVDIYDFCPIQFPADDNTADWKTTHFDFHSIHDNLLKLDILGHDDPTMMRMLQDLTGLDPKQIPMNDEKTMKIFSSTDSLGVTPDQIRSPVATYGIPEMGTKFVRQMLQETSPSTFADLLQISGLSHGTGVWLGNAQELIRQGICTIKTVIGCRDDIMQYLIHKAGMDAGLAFKITESVRKGKGLTEEWKEEMTKCGVPKWYIDSCERIEYMFPKAHAAAYVISAVRTAYYKVHYPIAFYATYFSVRADDFDIEICREGYDAIKEKIEEIESKGLDASPKEKSLLTILEMALEMTARGFTFKNVDLYQSDATKFIVDGDSLIPPFSAIQGVGDNAAKSIAKARDEGEILSKEDLAQRSKATKTVIEILDRLGCLKGLPESNQLTLF